MPNRKQINLQRLALFLLLALFFAVNLAFLTRFPFVHSDESWLAGLTRNMMDERSLGVTETFFNLKPRFPHAIKSLFHLLQMPFIAVLGYGAFAVRLLSLLGGCCALTLFYKAARTMAAHVPALCATALLACDVQFIAASHLARQEILLCCGMLACAVVFLEHPAALSNRTVAGLAVITGLSVGLHPNSFLLAVLCGSVLLLRWVMFHTATLCQIGLYSAITGGFAALFVAASFVMDSQFIRHYLAYGESEFDLIVPITSKFGELGYFLQKLWQGVSGTYFVPNLKPQFILFPLLLCAAVFFALKLRKSNAPQSQHVLSIAAAIGGVLLGTVLIGRYNQTSAVFFVPLFWLLLPFVCANLGKYAGKIAFGGVSAVIVTASVLCVLPWLPHSYENYLGQIAALVPPQSTVIGNLNSEFYFENGKLLDYRNLAYLKENNLTIADYVRENGVEYLILSDELEFIYSVRPKWNMIYGNVYNFHDELQAFTAAHCEEVGSFVNNCYGVRIREEMNTARDFTVRVYRVVP